MEIAKQGKIESSQDFEDRCRALAQKILCKVDDPIAQRVHQENAERMLLASFVGGLSGVAGLQVRYANPQTAQEALRIALAVQEAEKLERFNNSFYTRFDNLFSLHSRPPAERKVKVKDLDIRVQCARPVMQIVNVPQFLVGLRATALETRGLKKPCAVMNVMA